VIRLIPHHPAQIFSDLSGGKAWNPGAPASADALCTIAETHWYDGHVVVGLNALTLLFKVV
jgi:hypothetical protein